MLLAMDHHSSALKHPRDFEAPTTLDPQIPNGHKGRYFAIAPFDALLPILPGLVVDVFIVVRSYRGGLLLRALCSLFLSIFRHHSLYCSSTETHLSWPCSASDDVEVPSFAMPPRLLSG